MIDSAAFKFRLSFDGPLVRVRDGNHFTLDPLLVNIH